MGSPAATFCHYCGKKTITSTGKMNFDPQTGEGKNTWWEVKCPDFYWVGPDSEYSYSNGHYYASGNDVKEGSILSVILFFIVVFGLVAYLINQ